MKLPEKPILSKKKSLLCTAAILVSLTFSLTGCALVDFLTGQKEPKEAEEPPTTPVVTPEPAPVDQEPPSGGTGLMATNFTIDVPPVTYEQTLTIPGNVGAGSRLYIDGREIPVNPDGSFTAEVSLNPGVNTLVFKVVSGNNAVYSTGRQVTYKPQPPLTLDSFPNPYVSETPTFVVKGTTAPRSQVEVNGVKGEADSNGNFMISINLTEGENVLNVTAVNADGIKSTLQRTVVYSKPQPVSTPPLLVVTSPPEDGYLSSPQLTITGVTDPNNLVEVYNNYFVADKEVQSLVFSGKVNNGNFSAKVTLSEGRNQLLIRALNAQGQSAQVTRTVTYKKEAPAEEPPDGGVKDTEPPVIEFFQISPLKLNRSTSSTSNTTNQLSILAKVTDDRSGVARVIVEYYNPEKTRLLTIELSLDNQLRAWTGTYTFGTNDQPGEYTLNTVRVYDRDGNWKVYKASELKNATTTFTLQ